jgi:hypothetical protein
MPRMDRLNLGLTLLNLVLLAGLISSEARTAFAKSQQLPVLRGRALEIVDSQGRMRAQILVSGPQVMNGVTYPETVLFRMIDSNGGPLVKLAVASNGSALGLSDGVSGGNGGVQLYARDTASLVRVVDKAGRTQMMRP